MKPDIGQPIRVLVVDDEPAVLGAYAQVLGAGGPSAGWSAMDELRGKLRITSPDAPDPAACAAPAVQFDVEFRNSAEGAVVAAREACSAGRPFAVAFLDMLMPPGPGGMWAAGRIREIDPLVEIVVCTTFSDVEPIEFGVRVPPEDKLFYLQKPFHPHEVRQMALALGQKRAGEQQRLAEIADFDPLTGLAKRERFLENLKQAVQNAKQRNHMLAVLYVDLDNFRRINDVLGHTVGDQMLRRMAKRMHEILRRDDIARLGGDQFMVLLRDLDDPKDASDVATFLTRPLMTPAQRDHAPVTLTASVGIAIYPTDSADDEALFLHSGIAMYDARRRGRGQHAYFDRSMDEGAQTRFSLEGRLAGALARNEFSLHYQPQFDLGSGRIAGMEALLRWTNPELGVVSPEDFIPLAEETGLIHPIGEWALRTACRQFKDWQGMGLAPGRVAVNVCAHQFSQDRFGALVADVLGECGLAPGHLELEITESLMMQDEAYTKQLLSQLRSIGVSVAIDDFGIGYSSLGRLSEFEVNRLKIDRSFVQSAGAPGRHAAIVTAIIAMARALGLDVVAEGVENFDQLMHLQDQKCTEAQGFLLSRPLPVAEATQLLERLEASMSASRTVLLRSLAGQPGH